MTEPMTPPESDTPRADAIRRALHEKYPLSEHLGNNKLAYYMEAAESYGQECVAMERELAARKGYVWISVSERLPMIGNVVLVGSTGEFMREPTMAFRGINNEAWINAGDTADFEQADITHWMPLPAAPSATNDGAPDA